MSKWDKIFCAGTHTDSSGMTRKWSRADLDALVKNSEPDIPVVIRHPENGEAVAHYGKIARLKRVGDDLLAQYHSVPEALKTAVAEGLALGKSVSIDTARMALRHLGLLGAGQPPAVAGLGAASFEAKNEVIYAFAAESKHKQEESMDKDKRIQELEDENRTLKAQAASRQEAEQTREALEDESPCRGEIRLPR